MKKSDVYLKKINYLYNLIEKRSIFLTVSMLALLVFEIFVGRKNIILSTIILICMGFLLGYWLSTYHFNTKIMEVIKRYLVKISSRKNKKDEEI